MSKIAYTVVVGNTKKDGNVYRPVSFTNNKGITKKMKDLSTDQLEQMVTNATTEGTHYTQKGVFPQEIIYTIYDNHPKREEYFDELYKTTGMDVSSGSPSTFAGFGGGSRRRRPSRKYKKSAKRVLSRKSRSTRRR